jgi:hypothetical protein
MLLVGFVVVVGVGVLDDASAVTKRPVVSKSKKKPAVASSKVAGVAAGKDGSLVGASPSVLVGELGPLKGTPDNVRVQLIDKWGFPGWWPAPLGRIISVGLNRLGANTFGSGTVRGSTNRTLRIFLDASQTIEQLADQLRPPAGFVRKPVSVGPFGEQTVVFEKDGRVVLSVSLLVTNGSWFDGKYQVRYVLGLCCDPGQEPPLFVLPSASLAKLSLVPPGAVVDEASFQLSVSRRYENADGSGTEVNTPDAPVYSAFVTFSNAPSGYVDQVRQAPFAGFQLEANTTGNPDYVAFRNTANRETYDLGLLPSKLWMSSVFHTFLAGEILPG